MDEINLCPRNLHYLRQMENQSPYRLDRYKNSLMNIKSCFYLRGGRIFLPLAHIRWRKLFTWSENFCVGEGKNMEGVGEERW